MYDDLFYSAVVRRFGSRIAYGGRNIEICGIISVFLYYIANCLILSTRIFKSRYFKKPRALALKLFLKLIIYLCCEKIKMHLTRGKVLKKVEHILVNSAGFSVHNIAEKHLFQLFALHIIFLA